MLYSVKVIKLNSLWNGTDFSKSFLQPLWPHYLKQYIPSKIFSSFTSQSRVSRIAIEKILCSKLCAIFVVCDYLATITTLMRPLILGVINGASMCESLQNKGHDDRHVVSRPVFKAVRLQAVFKARLQSRLQAVFKTLRRSRTSLREALKIRIADFKGCVLLPLLLLLFE